MTYSASSSPTDTWTSVCTDSSGKRIFAVDGTGGKVYNSQDGGATWTSKAISGSYYSSKNVFGVYCSEDGYSAAAVIAQNGTWEMNAVWYYTNGAWSGRAIWTMPTNSFSCSKDLSCIAVSTTGYVSYYTMTDSLACTGRTGRDVLDSFGLAQILGGGATNDAAIVAQSRTGNTQLWAQLGKVYITYTKASQEPSSTYAATLDTGSTSVVFFTAAAIDG